VYLDDCENVTSAGVKELCDVLSKRQLMR
jgi:hypothetical protein